MRHVRGAWMAAGFAGVAAGMQMSPHAVDGAKCIDGTTPYVFASVQQGVTDWVIQLGIQSITTSFCIDAEHCALFAVPPAAPPAAPGPMSPSVSGPQSDNCTVNPTFCKFNQAQISMCDQSLFLGDADVVSGNVTLHFQGAKLLEASLKALAAAGLASAERVLLNGVGLGGSAVIMQADKVGAQLKVLAPGLKDYRAVSADGIHPKTNHILMPQKGADTGLDFLSPILKSILELSNGKGALVPACAAKHPSDPWMCMYANETLPYTTTPIYLVNQLASVWDTQCDITGEIQPNALQIGCAPKDSPVAYQYHLCFQYIHRCNAAQIHYVVAPFQQQYINDTVSTGIFAKPGNGAFMHSCRSGGYWVSGVPGKGEWQMISIGGLTMQQAVTNWWTAPSSAPSVFTKDCIWIESAPFFCNPVCSTLPGPFLQEADEPMVV